MRQSVRMSAVETAVDMGIGLVLSAVLNRYYLGLPVDVALEAVGVYTLASMCRRFLTRRAFASLEHDRNAGVPSSNG